MRLLFSFHPFFSSNVILTNDPTGKLFWKNLSVIELSYKVELWVPYPYLIKNADFFQNLEVFFQLLKFRYKVHWRPVRGEIVDSPWSIAVERRPLVVNHGVNKNELGHNKVVQFLVLENFERYQKYSFLTFVKSTKTPKYRIVVFIRLIIQSWHHQLNFSVEFSVPQNSNFCPKMAIFIFF